jgi:HEAT repeat protein
MRTNRDFAWNEGTKSRMPTIMPIRLHVSVGKMLRLSVIGALLGGTASGQEVQSQAEKLAYGADKANVPDAIAKVKSGEFAAVHVDMIARAGAVEAIPSLKQQFVHADDSLLKAKIAAAIVRLGDKDDTYWDFLVKLATPALESDAPDFMSYDSQGKAESGPSPEFVAWADAHNLPHAGLLEESRYLLPGMVAILGWSRDPRAIPLLRQALLSRNYMIEIAAAMGLAEIGDKDSIPLIVDACRKAPADAAAVIAESLVYFDDNSAQSAVDQFIPKDIAKIYRDAKAHGNTKPLSPPLYDKLPNQ